MKEYADLDKISTISLLEKMRFMELEIEKQVLIYNKIRLELIRRFPDIAKNEEFKEKKVLN